MARIAAALSGGVDSAVAAARLVEAGEEVVGLTARLVETTSRTGDPASHEVPAAEVCRRLGIEHHVVDLRAQFRTHVLEYFITSYAQGLTPNPCLPCNRLVKFGALLEAALDLGCEALATGHYALRALRATRWGIRRGADADRDQSYVLALLTPEQVSRARFPLGDGLKRDVLREAQERGLPVLARDSQDLCFLPGRTEYGEYLAETLRADPGPIVDSSGRRLGLHRGLIFYTVGQRRGLGLRGGQRLYVLAKDPDRNALVVGEREELCRLEFEVEGVNWVSIEPPGTGQALDCLVMVRYRGSLIRGEVSLSEQDHCHVRVSPHDQAVAPGQGAVFYDDAGWLLGGGSIAMPGRDERVF